VKWSSFRHPSGGREYVERRLPGVIGRQPPDTGDGRVASMNRVSPSRGGRGASGKEHYPTSVYRVRSCIAVSIGMSELNLISCCFYE